MELSIVTTMYDSAPYLEEFYSRICTAAEKITSNYEIIFVNDGSPDNSLEIAINLYERDKGIKIVDLSRNFGQHKAMMMGLAQAKGELIFLIDCDLEEEPELLGEFHSEMVSSGVDVVYGVRDRRKGRVIERATGWIFYKLFNMLSSVPIAANPLNARLMSQRYVGNLLQHREREFFMAGLWEITGFKQTSVVAPKHSKGTSSYSIGRKISIFVNAITSFSNKPLVMIFYLGCVILLVSSVVALYLIIMRLFFRVFFSGWASLIVSIWLLAGMIIFSLGILGIYLSKIFIETKKRPYAVVRKIYDHD